MIFLYRMNLTRKYLVAHFFSILNGWNKKIFCTFSSMEDTSLYFFMNQRRLTPIILLCYLRAAWCMKLSPIRSSEEGLNHIESIIHSFTLHYKKLFLLLKLGTIKSHNSNFTVTLKLPFILLCYLKYYTMLQYFRYQNYYG